MTNNSQAAKPASTASNAQEEVDDFLKELDNEFGKKARLKKDKGVEALNRAFHEANPQLERIAGGQLPSEPAGSYSWDAHLAWLRRGDASGYAPPRWLPEARVTWIVHQQCAVCAETTWYTGNEYVRFRRNYAHSYKILGGAVVRASASVLRRIGECDPHLVAYGLPDGQALPEELHESAELVLRCPACFHLERACHDLWNAASIPATQQELPGLDDLLKEINNGS